MTLYHNQYNINFLEKKFINKIFSENDIIVFIDYDKNHIQFEIYDGNKTFHYDKWFFHKISFNSDFIENDLNGIIFLLNSYISFKRKIVFLNDTLINSENKKNFYFYSLDIFQKKIIKQSVFELLFFSEENLNLNKFSIFNNIFQFFNFNFLYKLKIEKILNSLFEKLDNNFYFENYENYMNTFINNKEEFCKKTDFEYFNNNFIFTNKFQISSLPNYKNVRKILDVVIPLKDIETKEKFLAIYAPNINILNYFFTKIIFITEEILMKILFNNYKEILNLKFDYQTNLEIILNFSLFNKISKIILKQNLEQYFILFYNDENNLFLELDLIKEKFENFYSNLDNGFVEEKRNYLTNLKFKIEKFSIDKNKLAIIEKITKITKNSNEKYVFLEKKIFDLLNNELKEFESFEIGYICSSNKFYIDKIIYLGNKYDNNIVNNLNIKKIIIINDNFDMSII